MNKLMKLACLAGFALSLLLTACDDPIDNNVVTGVDTVALVNEFIATKVNEAYLWTATIDWKSFDLKKETNSYTFFDKLIYKDDRWSQLTKDIKAMENNFAGVSTTYGYELTFGGYANTSNHFYAVVRYVYPNSPAAKAGLKRGDFIVSLNGGNITNQNYADLYYASGITIGLGELADNTLTATDKTVRMTAVEMYEDPVVYRSIIEKGQHKIGYLFYTSYTMKSEAELIKVFTEFKSKGVTDVVLDLRYNGGGYARTAVLLSSILAPTTTVKAKEIFTMQVWNDAYMEYFKKNNHNTKEHFTDTLPVNMNLKRLYVLTSHRTASASESTIVGLKPYLDVVLIGDTTHGKFCGGITISPEKYIENWGMYLMVYRFANKTGIESFTGGFIPHIAVTEKLPYLPLGDERDPLLAQAIGRITGKVPVTTRSAEADYPFVPDRSKERMKPLDNKMIDTRNLWRR